MFHAVLHVSVKINLYYIVFILLTAADVEDFAPSGSISSSEVTEEAVVGDDAFQGGISMMMKSFGSEIQQNIAVSNPHNAQSHTTKQRIRQSGVY